MKNLLFKKAIYTSFVFFLLASSQAFSSIEEDESIDTILVNCMESNANLARESYLEVVRYSNEGTADTVLETTVHNFHLNEGDEDWPPFLYNSVKPITIHYYGSPQYLDLDFEIPPVLK